jgi:hypothetical protein
MVPGLNVGWAPPTSHFSTAILQNYLLMPRKSVLPNPPDRRHFNKPVKSGIWPVSYFIDQAVFDRIEMDIIGMPAEIVFITDEMFPKTSLPDGGLTILGTSSCQQFCFVKEWPYSAGKKCFNQPPALGKISILRGQGPEAMHVVGEQYPGINGERESFSYFDSALSG